MTEKSKQPMDRNKEIYRVTLTGGAVNVVLGTLLMYGLGRIHGKMESLEKNRELEE